MLPPNPLESIGLYNYNARYYDPTIGRFISADIISPDIINPQSLNRYSYCLNNPLKYIDPTGLDTIVLGGTGMTKEDVEAWIQWLKENGYIPEDEYCIALGDDWGPVNVWPRLDDLLETLQDESLTDISLIGFSEGAAAIGKFLSMLAENPDIIPESVINQLNAAMMLECVTGELASAVSWGFSRSELYGLPDKLAAVGINIKLADIWNRASIVHGKELRGWGEYSHPYDSRSWWEKGLSWVFGGAYDIYQVIRTSAFHNDVRYNDKALKVMRSTCYD